MENKSSNRKCLRSLLFVHLLVLTTNYYFCVKAMEPATSPQWTPWYFTGNDDVTISAPLEIIKKYSETLKGLIDDFTESGLGSSKDKPIPLDFSSTTLNAVFQITKKLDESITTKSLEPKKEIDTTVNTLPLDQLIQCIQCATHFGFSDDVLKIFGYPIVTIIKEKYPTEPATYEIIHTLPSDFFRNFVAPTLMEPLIEYIKKIILQKYGNSRKTSFSTVGEAGASVGKFFDNDKIVIGKYANGTDTNNIALEMLTETGALLTDFEKTAANTNRNVMSLSSYKDKFIGVGTANGTSSNPLEIWNISNPNDRKKCILTFPIGTSIEHSAFSTNGTYFVSISSHSIDIWKINDGTKSIIDWDQPQPTLDQPMCSIPWTYIMTNNICFVSDTEFLTVVVSTDDDFINLIRFTITGNKCEPNTQPIFHDEDIPISMNTAFDNNGNKVAIVYATANINAINYEECKLIIMDIKNNKHTEPQNLPPRTLSNLFYSIAFSPDGTLIACGTSNKIFIYNVRGTLLTTLNGLLHNFSLQFSPDNKKLLSLTGRYEGNRFIPDGKDVGIWNLFTKEEMLGLKNISNLDSQGALPLYRLYVQKIRNNTPATISPAEISVIDYLDANIQNVLQKAGLFTQSWKAWLIQQPAWKKIVGGAAVTGVGAYGVYKLYNKYYPKK